jgi:hypothetical protein
MIAPGESLQRAGHDVTVVKSQDRSVRVHMSGEEVVKVETDADVVVFQRVTHSRLAKAVPILRRQGVAVVIDVDDDLTSIHPSNPAWPGLHPRNEGTKRPGGAVSMNSWRNLNYACREATLVTVSTSALLSVYASHGRGVVLDNYLPSAYDNIPHTDSDVIGWPASYHSHPNDPETVGGAVSRLVSEGAKFVVRGDPSGAGTAFGLGHDPEGFPVPIDRWPHAVADIGIGIAPLADTKFNRSKSRLKPLEMCAAGVPWVASPRAEYTRLHALSVTKDHPMGAGILADRPRTWYRELKRLMESEALRRELSEAGRAVAATQRLDDHSWRWWAAWEKALSLQRGNDRASSAIGV